jgi:DNA helicase-2/ATP-dependent DNA helicase PcrA
MSQDYTLRPFQPPVQLQIDYAHELNEQQLAAVTAPPGPALVIAGAGSGKTRTLTYRVAYLLEQAVPPERILLLTFTNKAAGEMMRRVADLLGQELASLWGGTFHAIGNRILRRHATLLGYQRDFTILDREDSQDLIKACLGEAEIDTKEARFPKAEVLGEIFSLAVNTHRSVPEIIKQSHAYFENVAPQIVDIAKRYAARKRATNSMDFDDLLSQWLRLLQERAEICEHYQRRFQFILVDEYQDTNKLQSDLIDLLAERHHNVMVVGDDAQSIYGWRGANFENIFKFPKRYPETKIYRIETNYRSTPEILRVANAAIAANVNQHQKTLVPARKPGVKPVRVPCHDAHQQAAFVAQRVLELRDEGTDLNKVAVLYRSHFHALELQLELTRRHIPFSITSGIRFFEQAHIKDVTAYLKLVVNPRDELAFKRLALMMRGIGPKGADKLWQKFVEQVQSQKAEGEGQKAVEKSRVEGRESRVASDESQITKHEARCSVSAVLRAVAEAVPAKAASAWQQFCHTIEQLEAEPTRDQPAEMIRVVLEASYEDYLKANYANYRHRLDDLEQLAVFSRQFAGVEEFLTQLALLTNLEAEDQRPAEDDSEVLRLSTVHQAKGLEFDVVFVIMMCDGLFPNARALNSEDGEEEERRLFYVAITRAKSELYLSYPFVRAGYNPSGDVTQVLSRFLNEIPRDLVDEWNLRTFVPHG